MASCAKEQAMEALREALVVALPGFKVWRSGHAFNTLVNDTQLPAVTLFEIADTLVAGPQVGERTINAECVMHCHGMAKAPKSNDTGSVYASTRHDVAYTVIDALHACADLRGTTPKWSAQVVPPFNIAFSLPEDLAAEQKYPYYVLAITFTVKVLVPTTASIAPYDGITVQETTTDTGTETSF